MASRQQWYSQHRGFYKLRTLKGLGGPTLHPTLAQVHPSACKTQAATFVSLSSPLPGKHCLVRVAGHQVDDVGDYEHEAGIEGGQQLEHARAVLARHRKRHLRRSVARRTHAASAKPVDPA